MIDGMFEITAIRKGSNQKKKYALIVPIYNCYHDIYKLISLLHKQTVVPDIIIVDNCSEDHSYEKLSKEFNDIIILKAKQNYGCAGGIYLGQKFAFNEDYEKIILCDSDAFPVDLNLIEELLKNSNETTIPQPYNIDEESETQKFCWFFHYTVFNRNMIKRIGFVNYDFFVYGDDLDYLKRFSKFYKIKKIDAKYTHPIKWHNIPNLNYYYFRNNLILMQRYPDLHISLNDLILRLTIQNVKEINAFHASIKAISDFKKKKINNNINKLNYSNDVKYIECSKEVFLNHIKQKKSITVVKNVQMNQLFGNFHEKKKKFTPISFLFSNTLITNYYTTNYCFYINVYYIVYQRDNRVKFFYYRNSLRDKLNFIKKYVYNLFYIHKYLKIE